MLVEQWAAMRVAKRAGKMADLMVVKLVASWVEKLVDKMAVMKVASWVG